MTRVALALGSNLGDREHHLRAALAALPAIVTDLRASSFYDTAPVGVDPQPRFLNAAATANTRLPASTLLRELLALEDRFGRVRPHPGAARTLDLDLILYGEEVRQESGLVIPHPRFRERRFVLAPLAEIAGEWRDPVTGHSVAELLTRLDT